MVVYPIDLNMTQEEQILKIWSVSLNDSSPQTNSSEIDLHPVVSYDSILLLLIILFSSLFALIICCVFVTIRFANQKRKLKQRKRVEVNSRPQSQLDLSATLYNQFKLESKNLDHIAFD